MRRTKCLNLKLQHIDPLSGNNVTEITCDRLTELPFALPFYCQMCDFCYRLFFMFVKIHRVYRLSRGKWNASTQSAQVEPAQNPFQSATHHYRGIHHGLWSGGHLNSKPGIRWWRNRSQYRRLEFVRIATRITNWIVEHSVCVARLQANW